VYDCFVTSANLENNFTYCCENWQHYTANCCRTSLCSAIMFANNLALHIYTHCMSAMHQSISISCLLGPQQQTCSSGFAAVGPCCNRRTDGWKPYCYIDPAPCTMQEVSIIISCCHSLLSATTMQS